MEERPEKWAGIFGRRVWRQSVWPGGLQSLFFEPPSAPRSPRKKEICL